MEHTNSGGRTIKKLVMQKGILKRWIAVEMRWKRNWGSLPSLLTSDIIIIIITALRRQVVINFAIWLAPEQISFRIIL